MSRMLALRSPGPTTAPPTVLRSFLTLARIHSDGWGHAGADARGRLRATAGMADPERELGRAAETHCTAALHYLRLASSTSPVIAENLQPFHDDGVAFMHNGALAPYAHGLTALSPLERRTLRGTSDSEIYFALVRRELQTGAGTVRERILGAVATVRGFYPHACLNAMMLLDGDLVVIASRGTVAAPRDALAAHGATLDDAEADAYNRLFRTRTPDGTHLVSTSGIDVTGWSEIPDGEVLIL